VLYVLAIGKISILIRQMKNNNREGMNMNCHPELDDSLLVTLLVLDAEYHLRTAGRVNWAIALGRHDIQHVVSTGVLRILLGSSSMRTISCHPQQQPRIEVVALPTLLNFSNNAPTNVDACKIVIVPWATRNVMSNVSETTCSLLHFRGIGRCSLDSSQHLSVELRNKAFDQVHNSKTFVSSPIVGNRVNIVEVDFEAIYLHHAPSSFP
jgi:hypothetical protein